MAPPILLVALGDAVVPSGDAWLSALEQARLAAMRVPKRAHDFRLGRYAAKRAILAARGETSPSSAPDALARIDVRARPDGSPHAFVDGVELEIELSLSHAGSHALALVAPAGVRAGCDVEELVVRGPELAADFFTARERAAVDALTGTERARLETTIWSAKESALKALREGLRLDTREVEVSLPSTLAGEPWSPFEVEVRSTGQRLFGLVSIDAGLVRTLAADRSIAPEELSFVSLG